MTERRPPPGLTLMHDPEEGCVGCPFLGDEFFVCQAQRTDEHPDGRPIEPHEPPDSFTEVAPLWCPLREGHVLVMSARQDR